MYQERTSFFTSDTSGLTPYPCEAGIRRNIPLPRTSFDFSYSDLSPQGEAGEICDAIELYRLVHRRSCLTFGELVDLLHSLGYHRE